MHIYDDHIEALKTQIIRVPYEFASISITNSHNNIEDYVASEFVVQDYKSHNTVIMKMRE